MILLYICSQSYRDNKKNNQCFLLCKPKNNARNGPKIKFLVCSMHCTHESRCTAIDWGFNLLGLCSIGLLLKQANSFPIRKSDVLCCRSRGCHMTRNNLLRLGDLVYKRAHWFKISRDAYLRAHWLISSSIERYGARNSDDSFLRAYCRMNHDVNWAGRFKSWVINPAKKQKICIND